MMYHPQQKKLRKPIPMNTMMKWIQEMHELAQQSSQVLRFKALRRKNNSPQTQTICPWLLQVTGRSNRLWELLNSLNLAAIALPPTSTPSSIKPLGRDTGPAIARPIESAAAARACLMMRLKNDGVICYMNANLTAFIWGMLQRENAD